MATILLPKTPFVDPNGRIAHEWFIFLTELLDGALGGTVTEVLPGAGITVVDGTTTPSVGLQDSGVIPGSYTTTNITVDEFGRVTAASNGVGGGGINQLTADVIAGPGTGSQAASFDLTRRHEWTAAQNVQASTLTDAATITPNAALSNTFYLLCTNAVGATRTIALPAGTLNEGDIVMFETKQPASGGPCAIIFDATAYVFGADGLGIQPAASTANNASNRWAFQVRHDGKLHGVMIAQPGTAGAGYTASSTTSLATGTGSKTFTTQAGLAYSVGARIRATSVGTSEYMEGLVTSYSVTTLIATMDLNSGTGTHADWNINLAGNQGSQGPQGVAGPAGTGNGVNLQTGTTYTYLTTDASKLVSHANAGAIAATLPQATGSFGSPFVFDVENRGPGNLTITPTTSTIDGAASLMLTTNQGCRIFSDGTNWYTQRGIGGGSSGPAFSAYASAATTLGNTTWTKILFATVDFDTASCFSSSRFTPNVAGYYEINAGCQFRNAGGAITDVQLAIYKNGSIYKQNYVNNPGSVTLITSLSELLFLNGSTDFVEVFGQCTQAAGTNQAFNAQAATRFTGSMVRPQ